MDDIDEKNSIPGILWWEITYRIWNKILDNMERYVTYDWADREIKK